jgi:hypothetical protein
LACPVPDERATKSTLCLVDVLASNDMPELAVAEENGHAYREGGAEGRELLYPRTLRKENQLRGFVEELGQDIESILENRLEDENNDPHPNPDPEALGVIAAENFRANPLEEDSDDEYLYY